MIDLQPVKTERKVTRNFDGKLVVSKIKYTLNPGSWESQDKTVNILAQNFKEAERLVAENLPRNQRFNISEMSDGFMEIHAISQSVKQKLYDMLRPEFEQKKPSLADRLLGE